MIDWKKGPNPSQKAVSSYALVFFMHIEIATNPKELQDEKIHTWCHWGTCYSTD